MVLAEEASTHFKAESKSNESGIYSFSALNPGTYTVTVKAQGFRPASVTSIVLTAGEMQNIDVKLALGASTETVEVVADTGLLDTGSANIATTLSNQK